MVTYTWIGAAGVAAAATITADWSPNGSPLAGDTAILTDGGTILLGDGNFQDNTWSLGVGLLVFTGDGGVSFGTPDVDTASLITTNTGSAVAQASTIDAYGNFVNAGTILADGTTGSSLTINVGTAVIGGTTVAGYAYNTGLIQADAGNTLSINIGATAELFSTGYIVADGGDVIINGTSSAIVSGLAPVRGMMIIEDGGTIETNSAYASTVAGTRQHYIFADSTPGDTLKIDNVGSFNGAIGAFSAGDTIDLGANLGTVTTLVYSQATGFLVLESIAAGTTTTLATLLMGNSGTPGFSDGTFAVTSGTADGFVLGTASGTNDTVLTTTGAALNSSNVPGAWQSTGSWQSGVVPGPGTKPEIGLGATSAFVLTTGLLPVSVAGFNIMSPFATLDITSDTTATSDTINDYNGTLDVAAGQTLTGGALTLIEPSAAFTIAALATLSLSGRVSQLIAPISNVWGTQAGNPFGLQLNSGTGEVDGAVLAGPAVSGGGGGNTSIGYDGNTSASVTVNTGGTVTDTYMNLWTGPTSAGTLTLNGVGASWTDAIDPTDTVEHTGYSGIGSDNLWANTPSPTQVAAAQLTIENFATMTDQSQSYIGVNPDSAGTVTVTTNGLWDLENNSSFVANGANPAINNVNAGALYVGFDDTGVLSVLSGGTVEVGGNGTYYNSTGTFTAGGIEVGDSAGATGTLTVSGAGSQVSTLDGLTVGRIGQGLVSILNGGTVQINAGGVSIGTNNNAGSSGTIDVGGSGAASALNFVAAADGLTVGASSQGTVTVSANGAINLNGTGGILIGLNSGANGVMTINGGAVTMDSSAYFNLGFGSGATGSLLVENGGSLSIGFGLGIGGNSNSSGQMTVTGGNVNLASSAAGMAVGASGSGTLIVNSGSVNDGSYLTIGANSGGQGSVAVNGGTLSAQGINVGLSAAASGTLTVNGGTVTTGGVNIGNSGTGSVNVSDNGILDITNYSVVGSNSGSSGTIVVGGSAASAVINLTAGGLVVGGAGTGDLTVNSLGTFTISGSAGVGIGQTGGGSGQATVSGTRALLQDTGSGYLSVGGGSADTLAVSNGGSFAMAASAGLGVGYPGGGSLLIESGGTASISGVNIAYNTSSTGTVTVTGAGSLLQDNGTGFVNVGGSGAGTLTVSSGGSLALAGNGGLNVGSTSGESSLLIESGGAASLAGGGIDIAGAGSDGIVMVTGTGSLLNESDTDNLNIGGSGGDGTLSVGTGGVVNLGGQVNVDSGSSIVMGGGVLNAATSVAGGTPGINLFSGSQLSGFGTVIVGAATGGLNNAGLITASGGVLEFDTSNPAVGTLAIASGATLKLDAGISAGGMISYSPGSPEALILGAGLGASNGFAISNWQPFDNLEFGNGEVASGTPVLNGTTLSVNVSGPSFNGTYEFTDVSVGAGAPTTFTTGTDATTGDSYVQLACFAEGTRIRTTRGLIEVEHLREGMELPTVTGDEPAPIVWIGRRVLNCQVHPDPETVWPVRVTAGAFGPNRPVRDLNLSPDHAVFVNGVLVPVKLLVNRTSIVQVKRDRVTYYHVELPDHAVILAEGLPVESYLDTGDRANFDGGGTIRLHPDFVTRLAPDTAMLWEMRGAAPLVMTGEVLDAARRKVQISAPEAEGSTSVRGRFTPV